MPSMVLSKLRSAGSDVLSSLPQVSTGFGTAVVYGGGAAHSRSTSAGSSSDGRSSLPALRPAYKEKPPLEEEDSLFAADMFGFPRCEYPSPSQQLSENTYPGIPSTKKAIIDTDVLRPLSLDEYHEERESIRSLKEYYEERQKITSDIGLPPGLEEFVELERDPAKLAMEDAAPWSITERANAKDKAQDDLLVSAFEFQTSQLWASPMQWPLDDSTDVIGQTFGGTGQAFDVSGQPFEFIGQPFDISGQSFDVNWQSTDFTGQQCDVGGQPFDISGQAFDDAGQTFNGHWQSFDGAGHQFDASTQPFDVGGQPFDISGHSCGDSRQPFDVNGYPFDLSGLSFDVSDQHFDAEMPWCCDTLEEPGLAPLMDWHASEAAQHLLSFDEQFVASDVFSSLSAWDTQPSHPPILSTQPPHVLQES